MSILRVTRRTEPTAIARMERFRGNSTDGAPVSAANTYGMLPREWITDLDSAPTLYIVWSYNTPILWVRVENGTTTAVIPPVKYSTTTSCAQGRAHRAAVSAGWAVRMTLKGTAQ